jgi:hypothetical protein
MEHIRAENEEWELYCDALASIEIPQESGNVLDAFNAIQECISDWGKVAGFTAHDWHRRLDRAVTAISLKTPWPMSKHHGKARQDCEVGARVRMRTVALVFFLCFAEAASP